MPDIKPIVDWDMAPVNFNGLAIISGEYTVKSLISGHPE